MDKGNCVEVGRQCRVSKDVTLTWEHPAVATRPTEACNDKGDRNAVRQEANGDRIAMTRVTEMQ